MHKINDIIKKCLKNDRRAKEVLYKEYASVVMGVARKYAKSSHEADDIFQEAFIRIFKYLKSYQEEKGAFEGWIYRITMNEALRQIEAKKKNIEDTYEDDKIGDLQFSTIEIDEDINPEILVNLISKLPNRKRAVLNLYVLEGYSHKEIADILSISVGTSKSNLHDARIQLAKLYKEQYQKIDA